MRKREKDIAVSIKTFMAAAFRPLLTALLLCLSLSACIDEEGYDDTPCGNFEALWKIIDQRYCFFDYKQEARTDSTGTRFTPVIPRR